MSFFSKMVDFAKNSMVSINFSLNRIIFRPKIPFFESKMFKKCKFSVADDLASRKARLAAKSVPQVKHFLPASNGAHHKKTPKKYARMIRFLIGNVWTTNIVCLEWSGTDIPVCDFDFVHFGLFQNLFRRSLKLVISKIIHLELEFIHSKLENVEFENNPFDQVHFAV